MGSLGLEFHYVEYERKLLEAWLRGDRNWLCASPAIVAVLEAKLERRPNRFFGEGFVASQQLRTGWDGSYKWLTSPSWCSESDRRDTLFQREFRDALHTHLGRPVIEALQARAISLVSILQGKLPVAPDLWLMDSAGHHFIEVKILEHRDRLDDTQLAGFAVLSTAQLSAPSSLEVVTLHLRGAPTKRLIEREDRWRSRFDSYRKELARLSRITV